VLDAIEVDAPVVRLTQHSLGKLDIDDVIARLSEPEDEEPSKPVSFALYNIALRDGRIELNDEFVQRKHELKDLQLSIPFISNLASKREIKVLPHLAFDLNGSKFDTSGESTPFTDTRQTAMHLKWDQSIWPLSGLCACQRSRAASLGSAGYGSADQLRAKRSACGQHQRQAGLEQCRGAGPPERAAAEL
jgi:hypothetical protein